MLNTQPHSVEEIMVGIYGEAERYNIPLSKKVNQVIEKLIREKYVLEKHREERIRDGLPYIRGEMTYYLSYEGEQVIPNGGYIWNKYKVWFDEPDNTWKIFVFLASPI